MPESGIISEEGNHGFDDQEGMLWLVDPLDGTTNFAHGFPWFAVSIALYHKKKALSGIVYAPLQNEFFCAALNQGAWLNGEKIAVSASTDLKTSLLATGFPYDIHVSHDQVVEALKRALTRAQGIRRAGAAAMDLAYVSCGRLDGFWEIKLKPWDTAAGKLLVEEAGGLITDFRKGPYTPFVPEILATNRIIHDELSEILKDFSRFQ
jgi:myo-inositol-1(or 4)-monophosphatase